VRITRFRRNRSLPAMTTSHLWVWLVSALHVPAYFLLRFHDPSRNRSIEGRASAGEVDLVDRSRWLWPCCGGHSGGSARRQGQTRIGRGWRLGALHITSYTISLISL
jgi:hypothetical protein